MSHDERVLASLHEAGHAVACVAAGGSVEIVTMNTMITARDSRAEPRAAAVASLAGAVSARLFGPNARSTAREHSESDLANAARALGTDHLTASTVAELERDARSLLLSRDRSVRNVASELRLRGSLSGDQVEAVCRGDALASAPSAPAPARVQTPAVGPGRLPKTHGSTAVPPGPHGWPEIRDEAGRTTKVLVGAPDLSSVARVYGLTIDELDDLNFGLPQSPEPAWIRVRDR